MVCLSELIIFFFHLNELSFQLERNQLTAQVIEASIPTMLFDYAHRSISRPFASPTLFEAESGNLRGTRFLPFKQRNKLHNVKASMETVMGHFQ